MDALLTNLECHPAHGAAAEHCLYMRLWLCVLTPEALAFLFQLSGWKQAGARSVPGEP